MKFIKIYRTFIFLIYNSFGTEVIVETNAENNCFI